MLRYKLDDKREARADYFFRVRCNRSVESAAASQRHESPRRQDRNRGLLGDREQVCVPGYEDLRTSGDRAEARFRFTHTWNGWPLEDPMAGPGRGKRGGQSVEGYGLRCGVPAGTGGVQGRSRVHAEV